MFLGPLLSQTTAHIKNNHPVLLLCLILSDIFFIGMFGLLGLGVVTDRGFSLIHDRTYSEIFQYLKFFWLVLCFIILLLQSRELMHGFLGIVFSYLLLDDYFEIHEHAGENIANALGFSGTSLLGATEFGELVIFALYGLVFVLGFLFCYRTAHPSTRSLSLGILKILFVFAFFAAVVDVLHSLQLPFVIRHSIGAVEDGGELLSISVLFWYVYNHADRYFNNS
ncbi:MAG: hypothetical protein KTR18_12830 [Acidiferrobacterales bacterium]|nr:hypothetical protein [Acidiferrobacterales bacterium]